MKRQPLTNSQVKQALFSLPSGELFTISELHEYVEKYFYNLQFLSYEKLRDLCMKMSSNDNRWGYFNFILVNGISYYWFDKDAYDKMRIKVAERQAENKIFKRFYPKAA